MKLYTLLIGLALPMLSQGAIVSNTSPGVNWAPFSVSKANAVDGLDLATLSITLFDGETVSSYEPFHFFYIDDNGFDTLTVSIVAESTQTPSSQWTGGTFFDDLGANTIAHGANVLETNPNNWGSDTLAAYQVPGTPGNMAYQDALDSDFFGGEFYDATSPVFLGFRFVVDYVGESPLDSDYHYGWVQVTSVGATTLNIEAWAYNDIVGEDIAAGVVPEPGTVALWFGAGGLVLWYGLRRKGTRS